MNEDRNNDRKTYGSIVIINLIVVVFVSIIILKYPDLEKKTEEKTEKKVEFSDVSKICELATLECYYHDVAEFQKDPDGLFKYGLFQYGAKRMWMEYNGIVRIGIDVGEVRVEEPTKDGIVNVYVPKAKILDINADKESISDPIEDNGMFTKVTADEKSQAFAAAQEKMKENAESDESILNQARNNAKEILKQYIVNVGKQMGQDYTVQWIDDDASSKDEE